MFLTAVIKRGIKKIPLLTPAYRLWLRVLRKIQSRVDLWRNARSFSGNERELGRLKAYFLGSDLPRIAFVKQEVLALLYCCPHESSPREIIFSTLKHTGPVGLFTRARADFFIVKTEDAAPECNVWKEVVTGSHISSIEELESLKHTPFRNGSRGHRFAPGAFSVPCDSIDWSHYDIVVSMDISVPQTLLRKYPGTCWSYCISEPWGMASYHLSHKAPLAGYDLFLNQMFRRSPWRNRPHEIDFPLNLHYYGCFHDLTETAVDDSTERKGIFVESHTALELTDFQKKQLSEYGDLYYVSPGTEAIINDLKRCKYFIRLGGRTLLGNGMVEAVAAGCLVLGDASEFTNRGLFLDEHHVTRFSTLLERIAILNQNPSMYKRSAEKQRTLLDYLCYYRPLYQLIQKSEKIRNSRQVVQK